MAWKIQLVENARKQLEKIPREDQKRIAEAIDTMLEDPFQGDVKPLTGKKWKGRYRKRVGRYRLILIPVADKHLVIISAILRRSEKTYR